MEHQHRHMPASRACLPHRPKSYRKGTLHCTCAGTGTSQPLTAKTQMCLGCMRANASELGTAPQEYERGWELLLEPLCSQSADEDEEDRFFFFPRSAQTRRADKDKDAARARLCLS